MKHITRIMSYGFFLTLLLIVMSSWVDVSFLAGYVSIFDTVLSIASAILSLALGAFSIVLSLGGKHILRKLKNFYLNKMFGVNLSLSIIIDRDYNELMILAYLMNFYSEHMAAFESETDIYLPAISCDVSHPKFRILQRLAEDWFVTDVTFEFKGRYEEMRHTLPSVTEYSEARYFHLDEEFIKLISSKIKKIRHPVEAYEGTSLPFGYEKYFVVL